jgi:hypothetical protein
MPSKTTDALKAVAFLTKYFCLYGVTARNLTGTASEITIAPLKVRSRLTTITASVGRLNSGDATRPARAGTIGRAKKKIDFDEMATPHRRQARMSPASG